MDDALVIAGKRFGSRLLIGTGKYPTHEVMKRCHEASGAEIVTVAVRRLDLNARGEASLLHWIDTQRMTLLPNTALCYTAEDAVRTCRLAAELGMSKWVKLEVLGDEKTLFPDVEQTVAAARTLVKEGFTVLPYIRETVKVPVIVDAGVGTASDVSIAMELGCDGVLLNTAVAGAKDPVGMARAMKLAVEAGRLAFLSGRIPRKAYGSASSPIEGLVD